VLAALVGCGNTYRPVVTAINPVGPAEQPTKYAIVISSPGPNTPGLVTFVDFSGDTVLITANVGVDPYYLILNSSGTIGYTLNRDMTVSNFQVTTSLLSSTIQQTTLLDSGGVFPLSLFPQGAFTYITEPGNNAGSPVVNPPVGRNAIAEFQSNPLNLRQEFPVDPAYSPIYVAGVANAPRVYAINQATNGGNGQVSTIETTSNTIDKTPLPVGQAPVYGVMTADFKRVFILNSGSNDITVINSQTNLLDTPTSTITDAKAVSPIWADFAPTRNELVVANAGDGVHAGSVSVVSIPLCSATAQPTNPNCDPNNPTDAVGFGTVLANVPVGINPRMVGVLADGTRAYVVNEGNPNLPCAAPSAAQPLGNCTISVVNLTSNTVTATIPITAPSIANPSVAGHPNYIAVTSGTPTGKVYVTSPESDYMTVIRTDTDSALTTIPLQGAGIGVRVSAP
jgi:DNA-binding beta-propeller fold protein YncE